MGTTGDAESRVYSLTVSDVSENIDILLDELRGSVSSGVRISSRVWRVWRDSQGKLGAAPRVVIYARFDERFSRPTLALESASRQTALPRQ